MIGSVMRCPSWRLDDGICLDVGRATDETSGDLSSRLLSRQANLYKAYKRAKGEKEKPKWYFDWVEGKIDEHKPNAQVMALVFARPRSLMLRLHV